MQDLQQLLNAITPEIYQRLQRAVELGKWPDGRALTEEQRNLCIQATIAYEHRHLPPDQHTGFIPPKPHDHCETSEPEETPLKWR